MDRGSITVEASLVVTAALAGTFLILFTACFLMDQQKIQSVIVEATWQGRQSAGQQVKPGTGKIAWEDWSGQSAFLETGKDWEEQEQQLLVYIKEQLDGALWFHNEVQVQVEMASDKVEISYTGEYRFPVRLWGIAGAVSGGIPISGAVSLEGTGTEDFLRLVRGVLRGVSAGGGR